MLSYFLGRSDFDDEYKIYNSSILIQSVYRGYYQRKRLARMTKGIILLQRMFREYMKQKKTVELELYVESYVNDLLNKTIEEIKEKDAKINKISKVNKHNKRSKVNKSTNTYRMGKINYCKEIYKNKKRDLSINTSSPLIRNNNVLNFDIQQNLPCIDMSSPLCTPYYGSFMNTNNYRKQYQEYMNNCIYCPTIVRDLYQPSTCFHSVREGLKDVANGLVKLMDCFADMITIEEEMNKLEEETEQLLDDDFHQQERMRIKHNKYSKSI